MPFSDHALHIEQHHIATKVTVSKSISFLHVSFFFLSIYYNKFLSSFRISSASLTLCLHHQTSCNAGIKLNNVYKIILQPYNCKYLTIKTEPTIVKFTIFFVTKLLFFLSLITLFNQVLLKSLYVIYLLLMPAPPPATQVYLIWNLSIVIVNCYT